MTADDLGQGPPPERRPSLLMAGSAALGRFITSRRFSSSLEPPTNQKSLSNYLTKEVLPRMDNYRNSLPGAKSVRPTLDDLFDNSPPVVPVDHPETDSEVKTVKTGKVIKFGWMDGVLMKCLLNIWGVMLYLRLTWVIGQAGIIEGLGIIIIANIVTIITALSMSAVCTNGSIKAGGIYYMISRSLGPEFGGAIGLMFTLANSIAVAMYLIGFCESLLDCLKQYGGIDGITSYRLNDIRIIGCSGLVVILVLAIVGMDWVTRVQIGLLALLVFSQVDFIIGTFIPPNDEQIAKGFIGYNATLMESNLWSTYTYNEESGTSHNFFSVFAVFFPAVTGIVAGANMSGDLKDPSTAIPKGTLLAIFITFISYLAYGILAGGCSLRHASGVIEEVLFARGELNESIAEELNITRRFDDCTDRDCQLGLLNSQQMMEVMSAWGPLIYAGCFAATLSSAIGSLEGAPRVFQAVAKDKLFPGIHFFAYGRGINNDPLRGYFLVALIALVCLLIGNLNIVSSLLSNFFVAAYCLINFSVFHVSITKSPSWRPSFKYYNHWVSLGGTLLCIIVMFLMDWRTALATFIIILFLYVAIQKNKPDANWGSSTQAQSFLSALRGVHQLSKVEDHIKTYRPKILVLSGDPADRPCLVDFANLIAKRLSLLECVNVVKDKTEYKKVETIKRDGNAWLYNNDIKAFYSVTRHESFSTGARAAMEMSGLGKLRPNMVMIGFQESWKDNLADAAEYYKILQSAVEMKLAVAILRIRGGMDISNEGYIVCDAEELMKISMSHRSASNETSPEVGGRPRGLTSELTVAVPNVLSYSNEISSKKKHILSRSKSEAVAAVGLTNRKGAEITDKFLLANMTQFRGKEQKEGTIDVYWLYDDGGLTLLLPHILTTRSKFSKCTMRIFFLSSKTEELDEETRNMAALLQKFRIQFQDVLLLKDMTHSPGQHIKEEFQNMTNGLLQKNKMAQSIQENCEATTPNDPSSGNFLTHNDLAVNADRTNFHLRLAETVRANSKDSAFVVMTLPMPKKSNQQLPFALYLSWLDIITKNMPPFVLIRGNQESVLTFYS